MIDAVFTKDIEVNVDADDMFDITKPRFTRGALDTTTIVGCMKRKLKLARGPGMVSYFYCNGVFRPNGDLAIKEIYPRFLEKVDRLREFSTLKCHEICKLLESQAPILSDTPSMLDINFKNCMYNWPERRAYPHSPEYLSYTQLPVIYDPEATSEVWDNFLASTFPDPPQDGVMLAYQIIALLLIPYTGLQTCFILLGEGSNGKSTFLRGISAILGKENISNVSLHDLERNRFASAALIGKLANICADLSAKPLRDISVLKGLTGEDTIQMELKGKQSFSYRPYARPIFSCNRMPSIDDRSDATQRRLMCIQFPKVFDGYRNPEEDSIIDNITDPYALSGIVNSVLPWIERVFDHNQINIPASLDDYINYYIPVPKAMKRWLDENIELALFDEFLVLHDAFKIMNSNIPEATNVRSFSQAIRAMYPMAELEFKRVKGNVHPMRIFKNIKLKAGISLGQVN